MKITNKNDSAMSSRLKEHNLMLKINSRYILTAKEVYDFDGEYYVVSELMSGSLENFFKVMCRRLSQESCDYMTFIIASAIQDLHNVNLIHRDLKSENILINEDGKVLVADLGLASVLIKNHFRVSSKGTLAFMAPEMILNQPYNHSIDSWGLGVVMYDMSFGKKPFKDDMNGYMVDKIVNMEVTPAAHRSEQFNQLMLRLLSKDF